MGKKIFYKMLVFIIYLIIVLPWIGELFLYYFSGIWLVVWGGSWLMIVLFTLVISMFLSGNQTWIRWLIVLLSIGSSVLLPLLWMNEGPPYIQVILGMLTIAVWIAGFKLASVPSIEKFIYVRYLLPGLFIISIHPLFFSGVSILVYICFIVYLCFVAILYMQVNGMNKRVSSLTFVFIILLALGLTGIKDHLFAMIGWVYQNVIVTILLLILKPISFILQLLGDPTDFFDRSVPEPEENASESEQEELLDLSGVEPGDATFSDGMPIVRNVLLVLLFLVMACIIYRGVRTYFHVQEQDDTDQAEKEWMHPKGSRFSASFMRTGKPIFDSLRAFLPSTREGKIRNMYRSVMIRMVKKSYPVSAHTTPTEVMKVMKEDDPYLFDMYNKVRYGGKKVTLEELNRAEENFKAIRKKIK